MACSPCAAPRPCVPPSGFDSLSRASSEYTPGRGGRGVTPVLGLATIFFFLRFPRSSIFFVHGGLRTARGPPARPGERARQRRSEKGSMCDGVEPAVARNVQRPSLFSRDVMRARRRCAHRLLLLAAFSFVCDHVVEWNTSLCTYTPARARARPADVNAWRLPTTQQRGNGVSRISCIRNVKAEHKYNIRSQAMSKRRGRQLKEKQVG